MVMVQVLQSFIGNQAELEKYGNAQGVIPWAFHHPFSGNKIRDNYIQLTPKRAEELAKLEIVRLLTQREAEALARLAKNPRREKGMEAAIEEKPGPAAVDK